MVEENNQYTFENETYRKTYWHTCSHILAQAVKRLYPEVKLAIGPSIDEGLYPGDHGEDRGGDAEDLQGEAEAGAV